MCSDRLGGARKPGNSVREMTCVDTFLHGARCCAVTALLSLAAAPAVGQTAGEGQPSPLDHWRVDLAVGDVNWRSLPVFAGDGAWQPLRPGAILAPPAEIETSAGSRVELRRGEDLIQAGADTRLTLEDSPGDLITLIRQAAGAVWYSVKSIAGRKFEVEGRYLVATVKGTEFLIMLGPQGDLLRVRMGVVHASRRAGGEGLDVLAGQAVLVTASGLLLMVAPGDDPVTPPPPEQTPPPPIPLEETPPGGAEPTGSTPSPASLEPAPSDPPGPAEPPASEESTGDVHGVNGDEQHNHGGEKGEGVSDTHGDSESGNGGGSHGDSESGNVGGNAKGP